MIAIWLALGLAPIAGGSLDTEHVAVGALHGSAGTACSATLIGPSLAITAAHCTTDASLVLVLDDGEHAISGVTLAPFYDAATLGSDVALLTLASPSVIEPLPVAPDIESGQPVLLVGFGRDAAGLTGERRMAATRVESVAGARFTTSAEDGSACAGDSGGAVLVEVDGQVALVGVISSGRATCGAPSSHVRLGAFLPWISPGTSDEAPTVTIVSPDGGAGAAVADLFDLRARLGDDHGVLRVRIFIDGEMATSQEVDGDDLVVPLAIAPGPHVLVVEAIDVSGGSARAERVIDVMPPGGDLAPEDESVGCRAGRGPGWLLALAALGCRRRKQRS